jgi:hypothetical protein
MIGLLALAAASMPACPQVVGVEHLWAKAETRWVMIGEMHGTAEMPAAFGDMVCKAATDSGRPVTVALEQDVEMQPAIDAFIASDGGPAARAAFLKARMWNGKMQDGRASQAMLALYDRLRVLKQGGRIRAVVAFIPSMTGWKGDGPYNMELADMLRALPVAPNGLILAYMGSVHAAKSSVGQGAHAFLPAGADLAPERTISLYIDSNGGAAWTCMQDGCAPHPMQARDAKRGFTPADRLPWRYDWIFELGAPATASPPAVPVS